VKETDEVPGGGTTGRLAEKLHGLFIFFVVHAGVRSLSYLATKLTIIKLHFF